MVLDVAQKSRSRGAIRGMLRMIALNLRSLALVPLGFLQYWRTGRTPESSYQSFIWAFCVTGGRFNDWLAAIVSRSRPKITISQPTGVLGSLEPDVLAKHVKTLRTHGCVVFERAVPDSVCDRLVKFATETPATIRPMDHEAVPAQPRVALFDFSKPLAVRYDYDAGKLLDNEDVQALLADDSLLCLAQEYLGCLPVADVLSMWWHTNYHAQPDSAAAQYFHFDMDRIKWLKIFIYLTDVGPDNGPHSFISGSHRTGGIPSRMLHRGYKRLTDEEVFAEYPEPRRLTLCAPRGSLIIEDTRGLHKGAHVSGGPRLMLQLQYSNSLFGTNYPLARMSQVKSASLKRMLERAPDIYRQYIPTC